MFKIVRELSGAATNRTYAADMDPLISRSALAAADPADPIDGALTLAIETAEHHQRTGAQPTDGQRTLRHVNWVMTSQPNGGLDMTVHDATATAEELCAALAAIGANQQAQLLRDAFERGADAALEDLDGIWFERDLDGDLAARILAYANTHPREFFCD